MKLALVASGVLHALVILFFSLMSSGDSSTSKAGTVSVEYVESVDHQAPSRPFKPKEKDREILPSDRPSSAPAASESAGSSTGDPQAATNAVNKYVARVTDIISNNKIYPPVSIAREEEGRVVIGLSISRQGEIVEANIETRAPFERLNQAALQSIQSIGKFPEVPAEIAVPLHLHVPLVYKIENTSK